MSKPTLLKPDVRYRLDLGKNESCWIDINGISVQVCMDSNNELSIGGYHLDIEDDEEEELFKIVHNMKSWY